MKKIILILILTVFLTSCAAKPTAEPVNTEPTSTNEPQGTVKEITMTAKQFEFQPAKITVKKGDRLRLKITSTDVAHGFAIKEYGIRQKLDPGKEEIVEFTADKTGTFTYYCSVQCGSGHGAMKGTLIVEP